MVQSFKELADNYIESGSIEKNDHDIITSAKIKNNNEGYEIINNFVSSPFKFSDKQNILLHKLNIYNMYIKAYSNCKKK